MHRGENNRLAGYGQPSRRVVWRLALWLALVFAPPALAQQATLSDLMQMDSFKAMLLAIANVNRAMRSASENPQDDFRRIAVQQAVAAMPAAIIGLAKDFQAGKLGNEDLPLVQQLLGGFVDKNAPDNFKKFMKSPSASSIPQVSPSLASYMPRSGPASGGGSSSSGPGPAPRGSLMRTKFAQADAPPPPAANPQVLSLADPNVMASSAPGKGASQSITYDEGAAKQPASSASGSPVSGGAGVSGGSGITGASPPLDAAATDGSVAATAAGNPSSNGSSSGSGTVVGSAAGPGDAISDLSRIELKLAPVGSVASAKPDADKTQFFQKMKSGDSGDDADDDEVSAGGVRHTKLKRKATRRSQLRTTPALSHTAADVKYWTVHPLVLIAERILIENAAAEQGGDGGGGGKKDGGSAADILFGIAAMIAAAAPIAVAAIQASADKYIAKTNADAQVQMTQITADTSKYLADDQKTIALTQANIAQQVAKSNNDYVTQRLSLQLNELRSAREEANNAEQEKLQIEQQYNEQRIALAKQQADENVQLAQQTLNAQLTQLGLSSGALNSRNSGDQLSVTGSFGGGAGAGGTSLGALSGAGAGGAGAGGGRAEAPSGGAANVTALTPGSRPSASGGGKDNGEFSFAGAGASRAEGSGSTLQNLMQSVTGSPTFATGGMAKNGGSPADGMITGVAKDRSQDIGSSGAPGNGTSPPSPNALASVGASGTPPGAEGSSSGSGGDLNSVLAQMEKDIAGQADPPGAVPPGAGGADSLSVNSKTLAKSDLSSPAADTAAHGDGSKKAVLRSATGGSASDSAFFGGVGRSAGGTVVASRGASRGGGRRGSRGATRARLTSNNSASLRLYPGESRLLAALRLNKTLNGSFAPQPNVRVTLNASPNSDLGQFVDSTVGRGRGVGGNVGGDEGFVAFRRNASIGDYSTDVSRASSRGGVSGGGHSAGDPAYNPPADEDSGGGHRNGGASLEN